jgi:2-C-methyl-D-erythritol 4-phosphate cytidylyltransferase/2-C-methyl-D-erythritol 2,4-cyclodiphosphate synthase
MSVTAPPVAVAAVLVTAGRGRRMGGTEKAWIDFWGRPAWRWSLDTLLAIRGMTHVAVVAPGEALERYRAYLPPAVVARCRVVAGGAERADSVLAGLRALEDAGEPAGRIVLVHDAARPALTVELAEAVIRSALSAGAAVPVVPVPDTLKRIEAGTAEKTVERAGLAGAQTPQAASLGILRAALEAARARGTAPTDDAAAVAALGVRVAAVDGDPANRKLTEPGDIGPMRALLRARAVPLAPAAVPPGGRAGIGFDAHRFAQDRPLRLGGVDWPDERAGLAGHSDGDVLLHAVIDALLGAAGAGDIGSLFPSDAETWRDADSADLLQRALERVLAIGWRVGSVDVTVVGARPRIDGRREELEQRLAGLLQVDAGVVSVKGTTSDGLGLPGDEGLAAYALVTLVPAEPRG